MSFKVNKLGSRPISRRQFMKLSAAGAATAWLASNGLHVRAQGQGGTMVWMGHQEVGGLGPNDIGPDVQAVMIYNIMNPLVHVDHLGNFVGVLAESFESTPDGMTYTFKLHQDVRFHDGSELTAEDVKYTFDYYNQPGQVIASRFLGMGSVEAVDRYTVQVNMSEVNAAFIARAGTVPIVPAAYHAEVGGDDIFRTRPIGTGAFRLREWRPAEFTELEAFHDHFRGAPGVDVLRLDVVPEASVRYIALQTGDAHATVWPLLVEDSLSMEGDSRFNVVRTASDSIKFFPLNLNLPVFDDVRTRRALMHATDRQRIINDLWSGTAVIATSSLSPKAGFYYTTDGVRQYPYDPEQARSLLDAAGWVEGGDGVRSRNGQRLSFTCTTITGDQARRPIAELTQQFLRVVGVEMLLAEAPVASILEGMRNGTMESSLFNWTHGDSIDPSPASTLHSTGGDNFCRYNNPEMDRLIEAGTSVVDPNARLSIYHDIQRLYAEDCPSIFLQVDEWINVFTSDVQGMPDEIINAGALWNFAYQLTRG